MRREISSMFCRLQHNNAVADPETLERGPINMKYKSPHLVAIFLPIFYKARGGRAWPSCAPPGDPLL